VDSFHIVITHHGFANAVVSTMIITRLYLIHCPKVSLVCVI
jgi:hypothetical protein